MYLCLASLPANTIAESQVPKLSPRGLFQHAAARAFSPPKSDTRGTKKDGATQAKILGYDLLGKVLKDKLQKLFLLHKVDASRRITSVF